MIGSYLTRQSYFKRDLYYFAKLYTISMEKLSDKDQLVGAVGQEKYDILW